MSEPILHCNVCGQQLEDARMTRERHIRMPNEKSIGPQRHIRIFEGQCPEHGHRFVTFPGEGHSTILASRLAKIFGKRDRKIIKSVLPQKERRDFQDALNGQYAWDAADVAWWKKLLKRIIPRN